MLRLKQFFKNFLLLSLPTLVFLLLVLELLVFRFILPATQLPQLTMDKEYLVKRFDKDGPRKGHFTMGKWARHKAFWQLNNRGWMSHIDYDTLKSRPRIAVIGDSFVMPAAVSTTDGFSQRLHELMKDSLDVYSFGVGSTPLSNYLQMARLVDDRFQPNTLIINIVYNDFMNSLAVKAKNKFWRYAIERDSVIVLQAPVYTPTGSYSWLQKSATFRYLRSNLGISNFGFNRSTAKNQYEENIDKKKAKASKEDIRRVVYHIMSQFRQLFPTQRLLFTMDAPREMIYKDQLHKSKVSWMNQLMAEACAANNIEFIDLTPHFVADYKKHQKRFEFDEDRHWNAYGHQLVADVLYQYLSN